MAGSTVSIKREVLEDLATRFLINVPDEEKKDMVKLCSHMELAHWFYLDHLQPNDATLPKCNIRQFISTILHHYPFLARGTSNDLDDIISKWKAHRHKQPLRGGIILNEQLTKCLLVQGYPFNCVSWGLPKGKLEQNEKDVDCAVREIYEETGLDAREMIDQDEYLEAKLSGRKAKMFVVKGVSEESLLAPRSLKEIKAIQWFPIEALPSTFKEETVPRQETFNGVIPFVKPLRDWIAHHQDIIITVATNNSKNNVIELLPKTSEHPSVQMPAVPMRSVSTPSRVKGSPLDTTDSVTSSRGNHTGNVRASPKSDIINVLLHRAPPNGTHPNQELQSRRNTQPALSGVVSHSPRRAASSQLHASPPAVPPKPHTSVVTTPASTSGPATASTPVLRSVSSNRAAAPPSSVTEGSSASLVPSPLKHDLIKLSLRVPSQMPFPSPLMPLEPSSLLVSSVLIPLEPSKRLTNFKFDRQRILTGKV